MYVVNHGLGDKLVVSNTDSDLRQLPISSLAGHTSSLPTAATPTSADLPSTSEGSSSAATSACHWRSASGVEQAWGLRLAIEHDKVRHSLSLSLSLSPFLSHYFSRALSLPLFPIVSLPEGGGEYTGITDSY